MSGCLIVRCLNVRCLVARCPVVWLPLIAGPISSFDVVALMTGPMCDHSVSSIDSGGPIWYLTAYSLTSIAHAERLSAIINDTKCSSSKRISELLHQVVEQLLCLLVSTAKVYPKSIQAGRAMNR